jgi:hypothetical protein
MLRKACLLIVSGLVAAGHASPARAAPFESYATSDDRSELFARWNAAHGDAYALDEVKRFIEWSGRAKPRECLGRYACRFRFASPGIGKEEGARRKR